VCAPSPSSSSSPIFVVVVVSDIRRFAFRATKPQATTRRRASRASDRERTARPRATVATVTFFPRRRRARDVRAVASRAKTKVNARRARTDAGDRRRVPGCTS